MIPDPIRTPTRLAELQRLEDLAAKARGMHQRDEAAKLERRIAELLRPWRGA